MSEGFKKCVEDPIEFAKRCNNLKLYPSQIEMFKTEHEFNKRLSNDDRSRNSLKRDVEHANRLIKENMEKFKHGH